MLAGGAHHLRGAQHGLEVGGIAIELARAGTRVAINYAGNAEAAAEGLAAFIRTIA
mgnify:CR=1 FL=1